jgi:ribosomal protein S18 acetylase RimI-like enzyme
MLSSHPGAGDAVLRLAPMDENDYGPFMERLVRVYAEENVRAGRWSKEEGLLEARKEIQKLLPNGRETPNHFLFNILAGSASEKVGALWLAIEPRGGFVYDLLVFEPYRRRGYAEQAMTLLEEVARGKGAGRISLHVFGDNAGARRLYTKLGYSETNVVMSKSLRR